MEGRIHDTTEVDNIKKTLPELYYELENTSEILTTEEFNVEAIVDKILEGAYE